MKKLLQISLIIFTILSIFVATAVDFIPPGNMNNKGIYEVKNATNISANYFCDNNSTCGTVADFTAAAGGNVSSFNCPDGTAAQNYTNTVECVPITSSGGNTSWTEGVANGIYLNINWSGNITDNQNAIGSLPNITETEVNSSIDARVVLSFLRNILDSIYAKVGWETNVTYNTRDIASMENLSATEVDGKVSAVNLTSNVSDNRDAILENNNTANTNLANKLENGTNANLNVLKANDWTNATIAGEAVTSGTIADARVASTITRDSELANTSPIGLTGTTYSLESCGNTQILKYNTSTGNWECRADETGAGGTVTGSGTGNAITLWSSSSALTDSIMTQNADVIIVEGGIVANETNITGDSLRFVGSSGVWSFTPLNNGADMVLTDGTNYPLRWIGDKIGINLSISTPGYALEVNGVTSSTEILQGGKDVLDVSGIDGSNITSGTVADARIASSIARDTELYTAQNSSADLQNSTILRIGSDQEVTIAGENITSGTVADARIASTIARDSELYTATNASADLQNSTILRVGSDQQVTVAGENITSGTVADARVASTIARDSELPIGNCGDGTVIQNTTSGGVECVAIISTNNLTGAGTTNAIPKWTAGATLGDSIAEETGSKISVAGEVNATRFNVTINDFAIVNTKTTNSTAGAIFAAYNDEANTGIVMTSRGSAVTGERVNVTKAGLNHLYGFGGPLAISTYTDDNVYFGANDNQSFYIDSTTRNVYFLQDMFQRGKDVLDVSGIDGSNITSGTVADARIASTITRDSEVPSLETDSLALGKGYISKVLNDTTPTLGGHLDGNDKNITDVQYLHVKGNSSIAGLNITNNGTHYCIGAC